MSDIVAMCGFHKGLTTFLTLFAAVQANLTILALTAMRLSQTTGAVRSNNLDCFLFALALPGSFSVLLGSLVEVAAWNIRVDGKFYLL
jgi:hypothetical protein